MILSEAKVTAKRQITLPIKVMKELNIHPGDKVVFEKHENYMEIIPAENNFTIDDFVKKYSAQNKIKLSQEQMNHAREEAWTSRYRK